MMLHINTPQATQLGIVSFDDVCVLLNVTRPTLERMIRREPNFPRMFKIAAKRYARLAALQSWVEQRARAA